MQVLPCTLHWSKIANMSGDQQQCYRARWRAACLLWLYAAVLQVLHRPGHIVRDICKHQLFVTLQHCLSSGEQLEVCGGYRLVHIKYHIKEIFHFFSAAVILTSRLHEFSNRYKDIEKFCTQDLFINLLYRTLNLWRSYEGWDLSSSIKGLFYYQHVDCGYYCVACRCIVCGHCSSHQPTDQRRQDCRLQERSPCCRAAVSVTWLLQPPAVHYEVFT